MLMIEPTLHIDPRTEAEYRRQKNSILLPIIVVFLGPLFGTIYFFTSTALYTFIARSGQIAWTFSWDFTLAMIAWGYMAGFVPASIAAIPLSIIARRVPVTPHLVLLSPLVGFGAMIPLASWGAFKPSYGATLINTIADAIFLCSIGAAAAIGSVLLAWAFGCVPSPVTKLKKA
jgi:hypothetical protein